MKNNNDNINLFTPQQVSEILQLNIMTIYSYIRNEQLPAIRLRRTYRIRKEDLNNFLIFHKTCRKLK